MDLLQDRQFLPNLRDTGFVFQRRCNVAQLPFRKLERRDLLNMCQNQPIQEVIKPFCKLVLFLQLDKRRNLSQKFSFVSFTESRKGFLLFVLFYSPNPQLDGNQIWVQIQNLPVANSNQLLSPGLIVFTRKSGFLERRGNFDLLAKNIFRQGFGFPCFISFFVGPEEFKIPAVVKNQKTAFIRVFSVNLVTAGKSFAQSGAPANHLPEFCLRTYFLKEHQIDTLRHIDTRVHHIHRHGDVGSLFRLFEIINGCLRIRIIANNPLGKSSPILGIQCIEPIQNKFRMAFVLGKNNGFAQPVTACHFDSTLHQIL